MLFDEVEKEAKASLPEPTMEEIELRADLRDYI